MHPENDLFEGLFDDLDDDSATEASKDGGAVAQKSLKDMTEEEREAFENSKEYKEFAAQITDATPVEGNMQGRNVQQILGLTSLKEHVGYSYNALKCIPTDLDIYQDIVDQSPVMQRTLEEGEELLPTFKYLHQDIFLSLIKYRPEIVPETDMHMSTRMNRGILSNLINTPEYISLRRTCRLDAFNSALGTEIIGQEAIELLRKALENIQNLQQQKDAMDELMEKEQEMDELMEENADIDEMLAEMQANGMGGSPQAQALAQQKQANEQAMSITKALANKIAERCDELIDEDSDEVRQISREMGTILQKTSMQVQEASDLCEAWGLGGGSECQIAFQNKKDALEHIRRSSKLKKLTDMIGRFKESAITEQKKKAKDGAVELSSVTVGDKVQDTLPSERMNLAMQVTKGDFYRRQAEKQLLVYSKEAHKQKNKGPIIVCVDTSGSMSGDSEVWSKAMTVGVLEIAEMQKRDFACIIYSDHADEPIIIKKDEVAPQKIIECAELFHGGGTDFESALEKAMKLIENSRFKDADILFITDGDCGVSDKFLRRYKTIKEDKGFKTKGVLINLGWGHSSEGTLKEFCDDIVKISDVADLNNAESDLNKNIFGSL